MATPITFSRLALRPVRDRVLPDGAWWPEGRTLGDQLAQLFALWPPEEGRISRVLYSPPDWDDHPHVVAVAGRLVKTGSFPNDDTHELTVALLDGARRTLTVIPADTPHGLARQALEVMAGGTARDLDACDNAWDSEGGR